MHSYHDGEHDFSIHAMELNVKLGTCNCYGCVTMNEECFNKNINKQQVRISTYIFEEELELMEA